VIEGDDTVRLIWAGVVLVTAVAALTARRIPLGQTLRMAIAWIAIFATLYAGFLYRDAFRSLGTRILGDMRPDEPRQSGETVRVTQSEDGHFWIRAKVNGHPVRFLIDSGATVIALSSATVSAAGLEVDAMPGGMIETANGDVSVERLTIPRLEAGGIVRERLRAVTAPAFGDMNVLGMNFLSSLQSWSVQGDTLLLQP
jgi:aspartyl protease family protein